MTSKEFIFCHLLNDYSGSPKVLSQVIQAVQRRGYKVTLYTGKSGEGFLSGTTQEHHFYYYKRFENKYLTLIVFLFSQIILFLKLLKYWNRNVVIYVNTMLPFGAALAGKLMRKNVYYHIHEISLNPVQFKKILRFVIQKTAIKILFVSKTVKKAESFKNKEQYIINNALPNIFLQEANKNNYKWRRNDGIFSVLMICSLKPYKGIDEFVEIASLCLQEHGIKFVLLLNASHREIEVYFKDSSLPSNITLVSQKKNVIGYYKNASLLLNLSRVDEWVETFGLTIIEAMAFGIPVIVPPVGGPVEFVTNRQEGYLISSYKTDQISMIIQELSQDATRCILLSKAAKKRAEGFREEVFEKNIANVI